MNHYNGAPVDGSAWKAKGENCGLRVLRGGSWGNGPEGLRASFRDGSGADFRGNFVGFRLAQDLD